MFIRTQHQYRTQPRLRSFRAGARRAASGVLGVVLLFAIGCSSGGGGSGSSDVNEVLQTAAVDLPAGQTSALLAWAPSEGTVTGYLVYQSKNDQAYTLKATVSQPKYRITGKPGDSIRILTIAERSASVRSEPSPSSPPIRFHAASTPTSDAVTTLEPDTTPVYATSTVAATTDETPSEFETSDEIDGTDEADEAASDLASDLAALDQALREALLTSDARLPLRGLSQDASRWIQSIVDDQVGAGVSLVGTGERGGNPLRDLVWADPSGQLFLSDGADIAETEDPASTFEEAIRLRPTERLAGLADLDDDGIGDWIIEDDATGDVWVVNGSSREIQIAQPDLSDTELRLAGVGDFNGNGQSELLWQGTDLSYQIGGTGRSPRAIDWIRPTFDAGEPAFVPNGLLAIADLNGDGRDDLLFRDVEGRLEWALALEDASGSRFELSERTERSAQGLDLVATLDLDDDGAAEIAWWTEDGLTIWDLQDGL